MTGTSSNESSYDTSSDAEEAEHSLESLVHDGDVVMLTTEVDGHLSSRPLTVAGVGGATLLFLVDATASWVAGLPPADEVNASIATRRNDWVSVTGPAVVSNDPEAITRLWSPAAGAYFDGADDERIRVLQLHMEHGEFWSAPGHGPLGRLVAVVSAAIGTDTGSGDRGQITP